MKVYPLEKYKFYFTGNKVIAVSTYEGKRVRGVAKADPRDAFDKEKGMKLAAARCNQKVAMKRFRRACAEHSKAYDAYCEAENRLNKMLDYAYDAREALNNADYEVKMLLRDM